MFQVYLIIDADYADAVRGMLRIPHHLAFQKPEAFHEALEHIFIEMDDLSRTR